MDFDELQLMFHSDAVREKKIELAQKRKEADISLEESERKRADDGSPSERCQAEISSGSDQSSFSIQYAECRCPAGHDGGSGQNLSVCAECGGIFPL